MGHLSYKAGEMLSNSKGCLDCWSQGRTQRISLPNGHLNPNLHGPYVTLSFGCADGSPGMTWPHLLSVFPFPQLPFYSFPNATSGIISLAIYLYFFHYFRSYLLLMRILSNSYHQYKNILKYNGILPTQYIGKCGANQGEHFNPCSNSIN